MKPIKRLSVTRETIRILASEAFAIARGGAINTWTQDEECPTQERMCTYTCDTEDPK